MKFLKTITICLLATFAANAQTIDPQPQNPPKADIQFTEETFDFGKIRLGIPVTHVFKFTNSGTEPLIISNVKAGCGCTTPTWTKEPIAPGKTGEVSVTFNAAMSGQFSKSVTVTCNASSGQQKTLIIKGAVGLNVHKPDPAPPVQPSPQQKP